MFALGSLSEFHVNDILSIYFVDEILQLERLVLGFTDVFVEVIGFFKPKVANHHESLESVIEVGDHAIV